MFQDNAKDITFQFEDELPREEVILYKRPEVCQDFQHGTCRNGTNCPERHVISTLKSVQFEVCKHWLRSACVNGNDCLYLHEYDDRFIPECVFYQKIGQCTNPECTFKHIHPTEKIPQCAAFLRGFCPKGPDCKLRHVKVPACPLFTAGFCPLGPRCKLGHPRAQLYDRSSVFERLQKKMSIEHHDDPAFNIHVTCFKCLDPGHIPKNCPGVPYGKLYQLMHSVMEPGEESPFTEGGRVRGCFFCGEEGHTMRECPNRDQKMMGRGGGGGDRGGDGGRGGNRFGGGGGGYGNRREQRY